MTLAKIAQDLETLHALLNSVRTVEDRAKHQQMLDLVHKAKRDLSMVALKITKLEEAIKSI